MSVINMVNRFDLVAESAQPSHRSTNRMFDQSRYRVMVVCGWVHLPNRIEGLLETSGIFVVECPYFLKENNLNQSTSQVRNCEVL